MAIMIYVSIINRSLPIINRSNPQT
eukprot:SAG31_NODE_21482_length_548_cov_1.423163_1_plen_24_part_10